MLDFKVLKQAVGELDEDAVLEMLTEFVDSNPSAEDALKAVAACQEGMDVVGELFDKSEYFVGDLIFAGELLTTCIEKLKPLIGETSGETRGTIVLGTVEGDIHDIGKNIMKSMCEAAGFTVIDIGIDQPPSSFVEAVQKNNPQIVGFSGVLTLSIDSMKKTIEALQAAGLRDKVKIAIGGNAATAEACEYVGADYWSKNAAEAVKVCGKWVD